VLGGTVKSSDNKINCGLVDCSADYDEGETVVLTAKPNSSYWMFLKWGIGACSGSNPTCSIFVDSDKTTSAIFVPRDFIYEER
jgi:hypothetical protein